MAWACRKAPLKRILRYYTTLSNLLCAVGALAVAVCRLAGTAPQWVLVLKYVGTVSVTVTMLTVFFFLAPHAGFKELLSEQDFFLHLLCPVLALVSHFLWDRPDAPFGIVWLGVLTVVLYGIVYLYKVLKAPEEQRWKDFYGFNTNGLWKVSYICMTVAAAVMQRLFPFFGVARV